MGTMNGIPAAILLPVDGEFLKDQEIRGRREVMRIRNTELVGRPGVICSLSLADSHSATPPIIVL